MDFEPFSSPNPFVLVLCLVVVVVLQLLLLLREKRRQIKTVREGTRATESEPEGRGRSC